MGTLWGPGRAEVGAAGAPAGVSRSMFATVPLTSSLIKVNARHPGAEAFSGNAHGSRPGGGSCGLWGEIKHPADLTGNLTGARQLDPRGNVTARAVSGSSDQQRRPRAVLARGRAPKLSPCVFCRSHGRFGRGGAVKRQNSSPGLLPRGYMGGQSFLCISRLGNDIAKLL